MVISDIGSTDDTALLCHTNCPPPPGSLHSGGNWFTPDGTRVGNIGTTNVPGFERNRDPMVVRLRKNTGSGTPAQGIYRCSIMNADEIEKNVSAGLYNDGEGIKKIYFRLCELRFSHCRRHLNPWRIDTSGL